MLPVLWLCLSFLTELADFCSLYILFTLAIYKVSWDWMFSPLRSEGSLLLELNAAEQVPGVPILKIYVVALPQW